jgi:outer membrane murein-binding lipoprotein Lpp
MFNNRRQRFLKMRSRVYVALLFFLSSLTFPFISGCDSKSKVAEKNRNSDSLLLKTQILETELKVTRDSLAAAKKELARSDSIAKAKAKTDPGSHQKPQKPKYVPGQPAVDYGAPVYESPSIKK